MLYKLISIKSAIQNQQVQKLNFELILISEHFRDIIHFLVNLIYIVLFFLLINYILSYTENIRCLLYKNQSYHLVHRDYSSLFLSFN